MEPSKPLPRELNQSSSPSPPPSTICRLLIRLEIVSGSDFVDISWDSEGNMPKSKAQSSKSKSKSVYSAAKDDDAVLSPEEIEKRQIVAGVRKPSTVTVETYDLEKMREEGEGWMPSGSRSKETSMEKDPNIESKKYFSGNPFVEKTEGVIHFYKENETTTGMGAESAGRTCLLCMLAIPATVTTRELLELLLPVSVGISHMRLIRDHSPNQYMVLLKFRRSDLADSFYSQYNGTQFNLLEEHVCHLVYVAKLESVGECQGGGLPVDGHTELPTCPVCLERMDESVDGILTILCNHSFHSSCLSQWGDTSCPVCRFCQTPELTEEHKCFVCGRQDDLWICLICGHIGCGRYAQAHAQAHFKETSHTFSLQVGGQRVWDYAGDNYVHRLIQSKTDGKPVQFEAASDQQSEEKLDAITLEYTYLLTSQLESQRLFFEERISQLEKQANAQMEGLVTRLSEATGESAKREEETKKLLNEKHNLEKKAQQSNAKFQKTAAEIKAAEDMNKILLADQVKWTEKVKQLENELKKTKELKEKEVVELQEQMRDVMFHLEAESKLKAAENEEIKTEIREGNLLVPPPPQNKTKKKK